MNEPLLRIDRTAARSAAPPDLLAGQTNDSNAGSGQPAWAAVGSGPDGLGQAEADGDAHHRRLHAGVHERPPRQGGQDQAQGSAQSVTPPEQGHGGDRRPLRDI